MKLFKLVNIVWDTDGENANLPESAIMPVDDNARIEDVQMDGADYLSNKYGWCVQSFEIEEVKTPFKVDSIQLLKDILSGDDENHEFFLIVGGCMRSDKVMTYFSVDNTFFVINEIDDTEQILTEEQLMDENYTNIGKGIAAGAFYFLY